MRRNRAHNSSDYVFHKGEKILVDANVWLFLLPPTAQPLPWYGRNYSEAMKKLLAAGARPVVEVLVLSEYINRSLRLEYEAVWKSTYPKFKDFRRSDGFARAVNPVIKDVRQILGMSDIEDTELTHADLPGILEETERGALDFNDGAIVETCRRHGFKLLTHDGDMQFGGIEVLTSNPQLLAACP